MTYVVQYLDEPFLGVRDKITWPARMAVPVNDDGFVRVGGTSNYDFR